MVDAQVELERPAEHKQIVGALDKLRLAARAAGRPDYERFADALVLHAQTEEQVLIRPRSWLASVRAR